MTKTTATPVSIQEALAMSSIEINPANTNFWNDEFHRNGTEFYVRMWQSATQVEIERLVFILSRVLSAADFLEVASKAMTGRVQHGQWEIDAATKRATEAEATVNELRATNKALTTEGRELAEYVECLKKDADTLRERVEQQAQLAGRWRREFMRERTRANDLEIILIENGVPLN